MAHVHDDECTRLREALESARARQQPPRGAVGITDVANPLRSTTRPEPEVAGERNDIAELERALHARGCQP